MTTTSFPPHHLHSSTRLSPSDALSRVSAYLAQAAEDASLHPDAILTESGPRPATAGTTTTAAAYFGLTLRNLQRVETGLQGRHMPPAALLLEDQDDLTATAQQQPADSTDASAQAVVQKMDWQDRGEFERQQEDVLGAEDGNALAGAIDGANDNLPAQRGAATVNNVLVDEDALKLEKGDEEDEETGAKRKLTGSEARAAKRARKQQRKLERKARQKAKDKQEEEPDNAS